MKKILMIAAFLLTATVSAQTSKIGAATAGSQGPNLPEPLRETLKNIPRANLACRKEDYTDKSFTPVMQSARSTSRLDPSCAITLEQMVKSLDKPDTVVVDIRSKLVFDSSHIDGALNMAASEIRTKTFLANKTIILIGDGKADQDLYALCGSLKADGFRKTQVLRGGMLSWILSDKPVIGTAKVYEDVATLTSSELFQGSKRDNIVIVLAGTGKLAEAFPGSIISPADDMDSLKKLIQNKKKKAVIPYSFILLANERFDKSRLSALAKAAMPESLLLYSGNEADYRQFLRTQNVMWVKQTKGPTKPVCGA